METTAACHAFAALGQTTRLDVFRLLVAGPAEGLPAGQVAGALGLKPNTLSSHLAILEQAGLVTARREGRSIFYALDRPGLTALLTWLTQDCCAGRPDLCGVILPAPQSTCC